MIQDEIWINHIMNSTVDDVINRYNNPAIFQKELVELINQEYKTGFKKSLMRWLNFAKLLKWLFQFLDIFYKFEGYLTVLIIRKK